MPDALAGRDLCGKAKTGSGKTLAFGLPLVERVGEGGAATTRRVWCSCRLASSPTRSATCSRRCAKVAAGASCAVYGGVGFEPQIDALKRGRRRRRRARRAASSTSWSAASCRSTGSRCSSSTRPTAWPTWASCPRCRRSSTAWRPSTRRCCSRPRSTVRSKQLVDRYMHDPVFHEVESDEPTVEEMEHRFLYVHDLDKVKVAAAIAEAPSGRSCSATRSAWPTGSCAAPQGGRHGRADPRRPRPGGTRERSLADFHAGKVPVLVATDVAARGIHVDGVDVVVHYDPTDDHKAYLHRSGRTARAGETGVAVTLMRGTRRTTCGRCSGGWGCRCRSSRCSRTTRASRTSTPGTRAPKPSRPDHESLRRDASRHACEDGRHGPHLGATARLAPHRRDRRVGDAGRRREGQGAAGRGRGRHRLRRGRARLPDAGAHRRRGGRRLPRPGEPPLHADGGPARAACGDRGQDRARLRLRVLGERRCSSRTAASRRCTTRSRCSSTPATRCCCRRRTGRRTPRRSRSPRACPSRCPRPRPTGSASSIDQLDAARTEQTKALLFVLAEQPDGRGVPARGGRGDRTLGRGPRHLGGDRRDLRAPDVRAARFTSMPVVVPEIADSCIVVNGVAKTYAMTGWRVGWMIGPHDVVGGGHATSSRTRRRTWRTSRSSPRSAALQGDLDAVVEMREAFARRGTHDARDARPRSPASRAWSRRARSTASRRSPGCSGARSAAAFRPRRSSSVS